MMAGPGSHVDPGLAVQVSRVAKAMITQLGFSKGLGQVAWSGGNQQTNLGQQMGQGQDCSAATSDEIDNEVKALVERAYRCGCLPGCQFSPASSLQRPAPTMTSRATMIDLASVSFLHGRAVWQLLLAKD